MQTLHEQEPVIPVLQAENQTQSVAQSPVEEHTLPSKTTRKQIVSKSRYVALLGRKAGVSTFGLLLLFFCLLSVLTTLLALFVIRKQVGAGAEYIMLLSVTGLLGLGSLYLGYLGRRTIQEAKQIDTGVPLTRANLATLPAPESLVRASTEPIQAQQAVLLRAAAEGMKTPPEQLVRASVRQE